VTAKAKKSGGTRLLKRKPPGPKGATKKKKSRKKKQVVLFIPKPEDQVRRRPGLDARKRVLAWPCAGRTAGRSAASPVRMAPPLKLEWRKKIGAAAKAAPVISEDGILYAADRDGGLRALDAETGEEHFRFKTDPILGASAAWPLVVQKIVPGDKVPISSMPAIFDWHLLFGDDEGTFYCVRRGDFEVIWRKSAPLSLEARSLEGYRAPVCGGGTVFTVDADGNLYAASARNGTTQFSRFLRGRPQAPPVLGAGLVLVATKPIYPGEPSGVHAIDANNGERRWRADLPGVPRALAATHEHALVGGEFGLLVLDLARAELLHRIETGSVTAPLALEGGRVFVPVEGAVVCVQGAEILWRRETGGRDLPELVPGAALALAADVLWVTTKNALVALDAGNGEPLGKVPVAGGIVGGPVLAANRLYVATDTGNVLAFKT
jgi:outer membrane protein assembly factor BamB